MVQSRLQASFSRPPLERPRVSTGSPSSTFENPLPSPLTLPVPLLSFAVSQHLCYQPSVLHTLHHPHNYVARALTRETYTTTSIPSNNPGHRRKMALSLSHSSSLAWKTSSLAFIADSSRLVPCFSSLYLFFSSFFFLISSFHSVVPPGCMFSSFLESPFSTAVLDLYLSSFLFAFPPLSPLTLLPLSPLTLLPLFLSFHRDTVLLPEFRPLSKTLLCSASLFRLLIQKNSFSTLNIVRFPPSFSSWSSLFRSHIRYRINNQTAALFFYGCNSSVLF